MTKIHPTALVDNAATLGNAVEIGPYCVITGPVVLEDRVQLVSHVSISGNTRIGAGTIVHPFASLGSPPQDLKFRGEASQLIIGRNNTIREHVTMNPGTEGGGMVTRIGDNGLFMIGIHVAHDCRIGDSVIIANNTALAGHVEVGDHAVIGGLTGVHQFVRIGAHAMIGASSFLAQDVIPFGTAVGNRAVLEGLNLVGLKRRGFSKESIHALRHAFKSLFFGSNTLEARIVATEAEYGNIAEVAELLAFLKAETPRGFCQPAG